MSLYWMSTPYPEENGDWHPFANLESHDEEIVARHKTFLDSIKDLSPIEKDIILKKRALENITNYKLKYFKNWISNLGRIFFEYPHDSQKLYGKQLIYAFPNAIFFISFLITFFISVFSFRRIETPILILGLFTTVYLVGISFLSSYHRFLYPVYPITLVWIGYIFDKFLPYKRIPFLKSC